MDQALLSEVTNLAPENSERVMQPDDPSPPAENLPPETSGPSNASATDGLPPLVLPVDPATLQAARSAARDALPPLVLRVDPTMLHLANRTADDGLPPLVLPVAPAMLPPISAAPRRPHPGFWWAVLWCLGFLFFTQLIPGFVVVFIVMFAQVGRAADPTHALENLQGPEGLADLERLSMPYLLATSLLFGVLMAWGVIRLIVGKDWKRCLAVRLPSAAHVVLVLLGLPAVMVLGDVVQQLAAKVHPGLKAAEKTMEAVSDWPWVLAVLAIGLGPALGEELWCRGFLGRGLVGRYGPIGGIVLTSLMFGLMHIDPPQAAGACALGLALHFVYLTTRSLLMPMLMHFLNNATVALVTSSNAPRLAPLTALERAPSNSPLIGLTALFLLLAAGYALYACRARLVALTEELAAWKPDFPGVDYPPPGSKTIVVRPALSAVLWGLVIIAALGFGLAVYYSSQIPISG
jgi:uncharacterized protein